MGGIDHPLPRKGAATVLRIADSLARRLGEVLTQSLRALERDGFITRQEHVGPTRRVEYELTQLGRSLLVPMAVACAWTQEHWDEQLDAREGSSPLGRAG